MVDPKHHRPFLQTTNAALAQLFERPVIDMWIDSYTPDQIITRVQQSNLKNGRALVLLNHDIWRYGHDIRLQRFLSSIDMPVFILTLGYDNRRLCNHVYEVAFNFDWLERSTSTECPLKNQSTEWGFSCLNNCYRLHRLILGYELWRHDLLDKMIFTQNLTRKDQLQGFDRVILDQLPNFERYDTSLPRTWPSQYADVSTRSARYAIKHEAWTHALSNVVTESEVESFYWPGVAINAPICSEKSFKPFATAQIPVYLAATGHLAFLKSLGFELILDDWYPDDYENLGMHAKIDWIVSFVSRGKKFIQDIYFQNTDKLRYNFALHSGTKIDNMIIDRARSFIHQHINQ